MAFKTLAEIRTELVNVDLGLLEDTDDRFGDVTARNVAITDAFRRLWPTMARLVREDVAIEDRAVDYTLATIRDLLTLEILDSEGIVVKEERNWRTWVDEQGDPPTVRLLKNRGWSAQAGISVRAVGYTPYQAPYEYDSEGLVEVPCDLEERLLWIVVYGARAFLYRRRFNQWVDFEQHQVQNRDNATSPSELFSMYQDSERQFQQGIADHGRTLVLPKTARLRRR